MRTNVHWSLSKVRCTCIPTRFRNEVLEMVTAKGSSKTAIYDLPTWQSVRIKKNLPTTKSVIIQLIPKLNMSSSNTLWVIANVRQCPNGTKAFTFLTLSSV